MLVKEAHCKTQLTVMRCFSPDNIRTEESHCRINYQSSIPRYIIISHLTSKDLLAPIRNFISRKALPYIMIFEIEDEFYAFFQRNFTIQ